MCFTANVSFGASVVIGTIGIAAFAQSKKKSQIPFASIPLIFAAQQFVEGFLWLALKNPDYLPWRNITTVLFIFIAQVIWPFWVPLSIMLIEERKSRKRILLFLFIAGALSSVFGAYRLIFHNVTAQAEEHHIRYIFDFQNTLMIYLAPILYLLPTITSLFVSSTKRMILLAVLILISFLIAALFFEKYSISVWCFFAAVISAVIFYIVRGLNPHQQLISSS